ncbi:MAG: metallophosphatase domain-containing protein [Pseudomonadota bacterium]|nr:metallophosphatase domain-containing protein [Pseudomonadota bacterium]
MRIVCVSDTHSFHDRVDVPDGDILVHTGDLSRRGSREDVRSFDRWLGALPHPHKVVIAGNHDFCFERDATARGWITNAIYLQDEGCVIAGLKFWGSPWQPRFFDWAFNLDRGVQLREKWDLIPPDTDVLLTHGPPHGVLDVTYAGLVVGCEELRAAVSRVRPRLHVFGHIHEGYGRSEQDGTRFVNASSCNVQYIPTQAPIVVDL